MKYIKSLGIFFISFLLLNIIISILSYFELLNINLIKVLKILITIISLTLSGLYLGLKSNKKGYLEGLKLGGIIVIIFILITIIPKGITFNIFTWFYYLIIISIEILSSTIGINIKKDKS
jgi:putative membrane protein (TIGR04086 family)